MTTGLSTGKSGATKQGDDAGPHWLRRVAAALRAPEVALLGD